jgi:NADH:ubiquinone oxidoreductase subunit 3 (subunit A)
MFKIFPLLFFFFFASLLAVIIFSLSYFLVLKKYDKEKISIYECGFDPFGSTRGRFDVRFYLIAILFIIFDLEITYLFPWILSLNYIDNFGFFNMLLFLTILTVGFAYEWSKGALDWE